MALAIGAAVAAALAVPLERLFGGSWAASLAFWALPALAATALWVPAALRPGTVVSGDPPPPLARVGLAWSVAVFFGVQAMAFYAALAWLPSILEASGYSSGRAGALLAITTGIQLVPAFVLPIVAARLRHQVWLLVAIVAVSLAGVVGLLAAPGLAGLWIVLLGIGQGGSLGLAMILPVLRGGDVSAVASLMAMTLCVGYLIAAVGPWLLGAVRDASSGWTAPMIVLIAITAGELVAGLPATRARTVRAQG
jgi:CP family cyanate transporter-like MFS transporter